MQAPWKGQLLMSKGILSIFRKAEVARVGDAPSDKLAIALYGPAARPAPPAIAPKPAPSVAAEPRAKLVFAFDATASREMAWGTSTALTDALLAARFCQGSRQRRRNEQFR
jgi:hypothetical protein